MAENARPSADEDKDASASLDGREQRAIYRIPIESALQITSSSCISSLASYIVGLVKNSLDGSATKIAVTVEIGRGGCVVEDNGRGISPACFQDDGGLGRLNCKTLRQCMATREDTELTL